MGWLQNLVIKISGDNKDLDKSLEQSKGSLAKFKGSILAAASAGAAAFAVLINWAKQQSFGIEAINIALGTTKQLFTDLISGQKLNMKAAWDIATAQNKINNDNISENYHIIALQSELNQLIVDAADQTKSHGEKLQLLTQAMAKEKELKEFLIADAKEELRVAWDNWQINKSNIAAREAFYKAGSKLRQAEAMDSRRLQSQFTGELQAQKDRADALVDAFTPLPEDIAEADRQMKLFANRTIALQDAFDLMANTDLSGIKLPDFSQTGDSTLAKGPKEADGVRTLFGGFDQVEEWSSMWEEAIMGVTDLLGDSFSQVFKAIGSGDFENVGNEILGSFGAFISNLGKMLVAYGVMKSAFFKSLIAGPAGAALAIGAGLAAIALGALFQGAASRGTGAMSSGGTSSGTYTSSSGQQMKVIVEGKISGKDLAIVSRRYAEDN